MALTSVLLVSLTASTSAGSIPELERSLARPAPQTTRFVEHRFSRVLKRPASAIGTLEYRVDGVLVRTVERPFEERSEIVGDEIRIRRANAGERRIPLSRAPQLRLLLDSFRALLDGRITRLEQDFELTLTEHGDAWTLRLKPRDTKLAKAVASIDVHGAGGEARCVEMRESDGDASITLLGVADADHALPAPGSRERARIESRCRAAADAAAP